MLCIRARVASSCAAGPAARGIELAAWPRAARRRHQGEVPILLSWAGTRGCSSRKRCRRGRRADLGRAGPVEGRRHGRAIRAAHDEPLGRAHVRDRARRARRPGCGCRCGRPRSAARRSPARPRGRARASSSATSAGSWKPSSLTDRITQGVGERPRPGPTSAAHGVARAVEGAARGAAVDPLARDAVGLRAVAADDGLPHVVVREVGVLVVGRVEVGAVDARPARARGRCASRARHLARRARRPASGSRSSSGLQAARRRRS